MRNLLFVAASTSHASWLCLAFECAGRTIALTTSTRRHEKTHKGNAGCCYEKSCLRRIVVVFERVQQKLLTPQWRPPLGCDRTTAP